MYSKIKIFLISISSLWSFNSGKDLRNSSQHFQFQHCSTAARTSVCFLFLKLKFGSSFLWVSFIININSHVKKKKRQKKIKICLGFINISISVWSWKWKQNFQISPCQLLKRFNLKKERDRKEGERERKWDSILASFTLNPTLNHNFPVTEPRGSALSQPSSKTNG